MASGCQLKISEGPEFKLKRFRGSGLFDFGFWIADIGFMESLRSVFF